MPKEYIYEPWTAPPGIQRKAKCIIGRDYPKPGLLSTIYYALSLVIHHYLDPVVFSKGFVVS
jgi:hypothetical protein